MSLGLPKKWRWTVMFVIAGIILFSLIFTLVYHHKRITIVDTGNDLLKLQKPKWNNYIKSDNALERLRRNWSYFGVKGQAGNEWQQNKLVQKEFDRQITEIRRLFSAEVNLKLADLDRNLMEYAKKRREILTDVFQKKSISINETLKRELRQKGIDTDQQLQKFQYELEHEQRLNLVNLQLQSTILELKADRDESSREKEIIQTKIIAIKEAIAQKVAAKGELLSKQLLIYERQRRDEARSELNELKSVLEAELENDLAAYQAKLALNFNDWRQDQAREFTKAIGIRREYKKKQSIDY
jgi:hypothetical protein